MLAKVAAAERIIYQASVIFDQIGTELENHARRVAAIEQSMKGET